MRERFDDWSKTAQASKGKSSRGYDHDNITVFNRSIGKGVYIFNWSLLNMQCSHRNGKNRCKAHALRGRHKCMFHEKPGMKFRRKKR